MRGTITINNSPGGDTNDITQGEIMIDYYIDYVSDEICICYLFV